MTVSFESGHLVYADTFRRRLVTNQRLYAFLF